MPDDFVDSLDYSLNIETLAMLRQINMPRNNIPSPKDCASSFNEDKNLLDNVS